MKVSTVNPLPRIPYTVGASRLVAMEPRSFRMAQYPDGSKRIQGGYAWSQGTKGGIEWRDLPLVYVDNTGQERK